MRGVGLGTVIIGMGPVSERHEYCQVVVECQFPYKKCTEILWFIYYALLRQMNIIGSITEDVGTFCENIVFYCNLSLKNFIYYNIIYLKKNIIGHMICV